MTPERRGQIRDALLMIVVAATFPLWGAVYGRICRFQTVAAALSLLPGAVGFWMRRAFYWMMLEKAPTDLSIGFGSQFLSRNVRVGTETSIGGWSTVNECNIGNGTLIGTHVDIFSGRHQHGGGEENEVVKRTEIGENAWIGNGATVFADVGDNTTIGAGAVVVKPIPANCIAAGNPAKVIKEK